MREASLPPTCPLSHVTCHVSHVFFFLQSCGASPWRVCYQRGLPRLVLSDICTHFFKLKKNVNQQIHTLHLTCETLHIMTVCARDSNSCMHLLVQDYPGVTQCSLD